MKRGAIATVALVILVGAFGGCRRAPAVAPVPLEMREDHCWWAVYQSSLPPDTVAVHFQRAFAELGLTGSVWTQRADTAWAHAGPTRLGGATYAARIVAYRYGDSTHFRHFVASIPAAGDTVSGGARHIGLCGDIGRLAKVRGTAPRGPTGEEKLPLWSRRP